MLKIVMEDEKNDQFKYERIAKMARRERDKENFLKIADEEKRHRRMLFNLYKNFYGSCRLNLQERPRKNYHFDEAIGKAVVAEYEKIAFYREILCRIPCEEMKNVIRKIMEEEQRHARILEKMLGDCHCKNDWVIFDWPDATLRGSVTVFFTGMLEEIEKIWYSVSIRDIGTQ